MWPSRSRNLSDPLTESRVGSSDAVGLLMSDRFREEQAEERDTCVGGGDAGGAVDANDAAVTQRLPSTVNAAARNYKKKKVVREVVKKKAEYTSRQTKKKGSFFASIPELPLLRCAQKKSIFCCLCIPRSTGQHKKKKKLEKNEAQNQISVEEALE